MKERINKTPVIVNDIGISKLDRVLLNSDSFKEVWLQELLEREPSLLPTYSIDPIFSPLFFIGREIETAAGFIDNFYISSKGYLVIVETKLWRNPEARREVVGQIIDYAKEVNCWDYDKINNIYKKYHRTEKTLFSAMVEQGFQDEYSESVFIDAVDKNISKSRFLLMIVGDGIREGVEKMVDFLNTTPNMYYSLALCELEVYNLPENQKLVIPQIITKTKIIERGVVRVEEVSGKLIDIKMNEEKSNEKNKTSITKEKFISIENWLKEEIKNEILRTEIDILINDLIDLGFNYSIGTTELIINYEFAKYNQKIKVFMFSEDRVAFQPHIFYAFVSKNGFSEKMVEQLLEKLRPLLSKNQRNVPYENLKGYYFIETEDIIKFKKVILSSLETFVSSF